MTVLLVRDRGVVPGARVAGDGTSRWQAGGTLGLLATPVAPMAATTAKAVSAMLVLTALLTLDNATSPGQGYCSRPVEELTWSGKWTATPVPRGLWPPWRSRLVRSERARLLRLEGREADATVAWQRRPAHLSRPPEPRGPGTGLRLAPSDRLATLAHVATLIGSFFFWAWLDRDLWFFGDEWDFLVRRGLTYGPANPRSIWFPHNEHWSTLPILLWRGLYNTFHLSSYWPYLVPLLLTGIGVMHVTWRLCRRAGVEIWVATAAVGLLGFLGAGAEDLTSAFQIGFVASVLFGLLAFDLLDARVPGWPPKAQAARRT